MMLVSSGLNGMVIKRVARKCLLHDASVMKEEGPGTHARRICWSEREQTGHLRPNKLKIRASAEG
jgi:hypothetical protein